MKDCTWALADFDHLTIQKKAAELVSGSGVVEKLHKIFHFVREIPFGFSRTWDVMRASEVIDCGVGYCNTKATVFLALCRASGIPARVHFGLIDIRIMHGILPRLALPLMPDLGSHSWVEVEIAGQWKPLDSYINDMKFYERALARLKASGREMGYSVSFLDGKSSCEFNFGERGFVHMGAVVEDHGVWDDPAEYFASDKYIRFKSWQLAGYPMLAALANRNIRRIRTN